MEELIEYVAMAMFDESHEESWGEATPFQREIYLADARVAIETIEEYRARHPQTIG